MRVSEWMNEWMNAWTTKWMNTIAELDEKEEKEWETEKNWKIRIYQTFTLSHNSRQDNRQ